MKKNSYLARIKNLVINIFSAVLDNVCRNFTEIPIIKIVCHFSGKLSSTPVGRRYFKQIPSDFSDYYFQGRVSVMEIIYFSKYYRYDRNLRIIHRKT